MSLRQWIGRARRIVRPGVRASMMLAAALAATGCAGSDPTVTGSIPVSGGSTIAQTISFESIDGPPRPVFDRLVVALTAEAERRELPVVTQTAPAVYRVRAYLATFIERKKKRATLTWAWEVLDTRENRTFRLTGEQPLGAPKSDVWAQLDDALLLRIAREGFDELSARVGGPAPAPPAPPDDRPAQAGPAVAFTNTQ